MSLADYNAARKVEYDAASDLSDEEKDELLALRGEAFDTRAAELLCKYDNSIKVSDYISGCQLADIF